MGGSATCLHILYPRVGHVSTVNLGHTKACLRGAQAQINRVSQISKDLGIGTVWVSSIF